jgi:predicted hydrocarbon binding protein
MIDKYKTKKQKPIQIFSKQGDSLEVNVIKSPVKLTILEMLKTNEMEFDEIVNNTGKSKSTISAHLKSLREKEIISSRHDPDDNRKKIFYLNSRFLGAVNISEPKEILEKKKEFLIDNLINDKDFDFSLLMFHTLRSTLIEEGVNIDPILYETGLTVGYAIFDLIDDEDFSVFSQNLIDFWKEKGLGTLSIDKGQIIKIHSTDCFECSFLPKTGKPACFFDGGVIEAIFTSYFKFPIDVVEVKCYTMGDEQCTFEIEPKK